MVADIVLSSSIFIKIVYLMKMYLLTPTYVKLCN